MIRFTKISVIFSTLFFVIGGGIAHAESPWIEKSGSGRDHNNGRAGTHSIGGGHSGGLAANSVSKSLGNMARSSMPAAPTTVGRMTDEQLKDNEDRIEKGIVDESNDTSYGVAEEGPPPADPSITGYDDASAGFDQSGN